MCVVVRLEPYVEALLHSRSLCTCPATLRGGLDRNIFPRADEKTEPQWDEMPCPGSWGSVVEKLRPTSGFRSPLYAPAPEPSAQTPPTSQDLYATGRLGTPWSRDLCHCVGRHQSLQSGGEGPPEACAGSPLDSGRCVSPAFSQENCHPAWGWEHRAETTKMKIPVAAEARAKARSRVRLLFPNCFEQHHCLQEEPPQKGRWRREALCSSIGQPWDEGLEERLPV